jgi:signal transduction histidine kinase
MLCYLFEKPAYFFFSADLPGLLYYSHIPVTIISMLIALFVFINGPKLLLNRLLLVIAASFSLWTFFSLITWTNTHSEVILFVWSLFGILQSLIAVFSIYFVYVFLTKKDVGFNLKIAFAALLLPALVIAPSWLNLSGFNLSLCDSTGHEGILYIAYYTLLGLVAMGWIFVLLVRHYRTAAQGFRKQILTIGIGIELFLLTFFVAGFLTSYLNDIGLLAGYELEQYGLFGMVVFMGVLAFMIVRFKTFNVGLIAAQALVVALVILIGSQLTFVRSVTNIVLTSITLVLTGTVGIILIRSVKREVELRKHVELLALDLEKSNKQQIILIHFITHQIKGFVSKSRNIFSMMHEGDFGPIPEAMKPMVEEGLRSDTKGVNTIQEILNAANIKSGKVAYKKESFDLKALVDEISLDLKAAADAKGLTLALETGTDPLTYAGDRVQLFNALKNIIDNSIKYTLKGDVRVKLAKEDTVVRFTVEDTGVGITTEDMANLFTEGGHGANSAKINVESTGFGLYIVKNIIEAHNGKVWAESDGEGKGSRFIVELPV